MKTNLKELVNKSLQGEIIHDLNELLDNVYDEHGKKVAESCELLRDAIDNLDNFKFSNISLDDVLASVDAAADSFIEDGVDDIADQIWDITSPLRQASFNESKIANDFNDFETYRKGYYRSPLNKNYGILLKKVDTDPEYVLDFLVQNSKDYLKRMNRIGKGHVSKYFNDLRKPAMIANEALERAQELYDQGKLHAAAIYIDDARKIYAEDFGWEAATKVAEDLCYRLNALSKTNDDITDNNTTLSERRAYNAGYRAALREWRDDPDDPDRITLDEYLNKYNPFDNEAAEAQFYDFVMDHADGSDKRGTVEEWGELAARFI